MGLGPLHTVSLAQARQDALAARAARRAGIDPIEQRRAAAAASAGVPTFWEFTVEYIAEQKPGWSNPKHAEQWTATLKTYAKPVVGAKSVEQVDTDDLLTILRPIWTTKNETANRVRQRIEAVIDAYNAKRQRAAQNPARWRGHLSKLLPKPSRVRTVKHFPSLPYTEAPGFMALLRDRVAPAARALRFLILTAARTNMVTKARLPELVGEEWHVPKARMKNRKPFTVPLSKQAFALVAEGVREEGIDAVFPGERTEFLSNAAMDALLERMGYAHVTVHGFRSTFKDWASESTTFANEVSEAALAHAVKDKTEAAYRRGELLAKRQKLMQAWADYLEPRKAKGRQRPSGRPAPRHCPAPKGHA